MKQKQAQKRDEKQEAKEGKAGFLKGAQESLLKQYQLSALFIRKCSKPSKKEYVQLLKAHAAGVLFLGFLGYIITFVHIPINNILVGGKKQ